MAILSGLLGTGTSMRTAVGMGYDVHRLVADKPLWIGGKEIGHSHGLDGHSDADLALHEQTEAINGALAAGDIGTHCPPSDPEGDRNRVVEGLGVSVRAIFGDRRCCNNKTHTPRPTFTATYQRL